MEKKRIKIHPKGEGHRITPSRAKALIAGSPELDGFYPVRSYSPKELFGVKIRRPSFVKNQEKRIKYREEFFKLKHGPEEIDFHRDVFRKELSPIEIRDLNLGRVTLEGEYFVGEAILNAINKKEKTITVKIHLDRQEDAIIQDMKYLLDLIKLQTKMNNLDLSPLKPRWDIYDEYLKVWNLHKEGKTWKQIARQIFPKDVNLDSAVSKVRSYKRKAERMIEEMGRRI